MTNREDRPDFAVAWSWETGPARPGMTAVLRVKNEARALPFVLPSLLRAASRVALIDNGSTDGTAALATEIADGLGAAHRLELHDYPFAVARCGSEHLETPPDSVHSLTYFYNWAFSRVRTGYALKWDGDMVLTDRAADLLRDLAWQFEACDAVVRVPRYPLYLADDRRAYLDVGLRNAEPWMWPNRPGYTFVKAMEWELPLFGPSARNVTLPDWGCVELKHLDADEFGHWSHTSFERSARTRRKLREWMVFNALVDGGDPPPGVIGIDAPEGIHVVDHVRETWLPERAREAVPSVAAAPALAAA